MACAAENVSQPEFLLTPTLADTAEWMSARLPVVIKPLTLGGSRGVELVSEAAAIEELVERRAPEGRLLVERAVPGPEYSWEALVRDGEVLFENVSATETTVPPHFVELTHRCGHQFSDPAVAAQVSEPTRGVLRALGVRTGLVHLEFRLGPAAPALMEVAVCTSGDYIAKAICLTYGFDLYDAVVRLALDLPLNDLLRHQSARYAAVEYPTCAPGTITHISGVDEVAAR